MRKVILRVVLAVVLILTAGFLLGLLWWETSDPFMGWPSFSESGPIANATPFTDFSFALDPQGLVTENLVFAGPDPGTTKLRSPMLVHALDAETGAEQWRVLASNPVRGTPAVAGNAVYFGDDAGTLYGVELDTGRVAWRFEAGPGRRVQSPVVAGELVVFGVERTAGNLLTVFDEEGIVYALDAATGAQRWQFTAERAISSSPATANGLVFVAAQEDGVHALDAQTGEEQWAYPTEWGILAPAVLDDTVFVAIENWGASGRLAIVAFDAATGGQRWSVSTGTGSPGPPIAAGEAVYVGIDHMAGHPYAGLLALDAATGEERWFFVTDGGVRSPAAVGEGSVAVSSAICREPVYDWFLICEQGWVASVYGLDAATGDYQWLLKLDDPVYAPMRIIGDLVYVQDGADILRALDRKTGEERWRFSA